jgi:hypothetical protein
MIAIRTLIIYILICFGCFYQPLQAQDSLNKAKVNIVKLKAGKVLLAEDTIIVAQQDTVIVLPVKTDYYITNSSNNSIYKKIQQKAYRNSITKELHDIILVPEDSVSKIGSVLTQKSEVPFLPYRHLKIRNITFEKLDVFGPTIIYPYRKPQTKVGKFANKIHVKTKDGVIFDHLLFKIGDALDPNTLAENERILRELPYIEDARIYIGNLNNRSDSVDLIIVVKDKFSKGFDLNIKSGNTQILDFWDNNIFGSGQELQNTYYHTPGEKPIEGLDGLYRIRNIGGSFINCQMGYNAFGAEGYNVRFWRDFFTQRTTYAGNLSYARKNTFTLNKDQWEPLNSIYTNFWLGRAFPIRQFGFYNTKLNNVVVSFGVFDRQFLKSPTTAINSLYQFHNTTYYLANFSFSTQGYFKSNLVYNYGKTEDIPYGFLLNFTHGYEKNQYMERLYNGVSISKGNIIGNFGYLYGNIAFGGFTYQKKFEQGVLRTNTSFFTNLLVINRFKVRHFINISFVKGYRRFSDEILTINNLSGIRGYKNDSAKGTQKLTINLESVYFTPWYVFGFRVAALVYADFGWVGPSIVPMFDNSVYSGFGLGFRIRNEKLVFKTIQLRFAYYPYLPRQANGEFFTVSEQSKFRPSGFSVKSPEIIGFQ